ncbi:hypothetical protein CcaverHIS631_0606860 [Cutaneotrichosporon cavernicola]|nr:hypothetical protein CcaverHIS631_0606860 [Cutaneotrichosporon cavernicola]
MSAIDLNHFPNEEVSRAAVGKYGIACTLAGLLLDTFLLYVLSSQSKRYAPPSSLPQHPTLNSPPLAFSAPNPPPFVADDSGMFSIELITYLNSKAKDPVWVKALVGAVVAMASLSTASLLWAATTMVANMIITVSILYGLMKKRSGIKSTDNLITRFIRMSLESQAATTAIALILLIDTMCVLLFHSKIYVVGLFYVLNSRHQVVVAEEITMNDTHPLAFSRTQAATIVIEQDTEMHVLRVQPPPAPGLNRNPSKSEEGDTKSQSKSEEGDTKSQSSGTAYSASPHPDHKKVAY